MQCQEAQELITGLVDNEVNSEERNSIETHLGECHNCRLIYENEIVMKRQIRALGASLGAPVELREKLFALDRRRLDATDKTKGPWRLLSWPATTRSRLAFIGAALVIVVLSAVYVRQPAPGIASSVLETHQLIVAGKLAFLPAQSPAELKTQLARAVEGRFEPMGYDLSAMKIYPISGALQEIGDRKILVTVYRGDGPDITCFTFLGTEADAPKNAKAFYDAIKGINFYTYTDGDISAVLHREGGVICILVSKMPTAELLDLARAKARRA